MKEWKKGYCEIRKYKLTFLQRVYVGIKVVVDFAIGLVGLAICAIPFCIIAIAIKVDSKGPVFFTHKRIGYKGREFNCTKFRSMRTDARHDIAGYQYANVDSYITKVGAFLRKTSLDELPQLFSLVTGKMSLIGYRPSQRSEVELNTAREGLDLYQTRPGITGWAQVNGRDILAAHPTLKAQYDGYYMEHISPWLDLKILFMSVWKALRHSDIEEGELNERFESESGVK